MGVQPAPQSTGANAVFPIQAFVLTGDVPIKPEHSGRVLAPFVTPSGTLAILQKATAALENEFRRAGFELHRVSLPPQDLGGTVRLEVVKFAIGKVTLEGRARYSEANVRSSLPAIREGAAPNFRALAVQTAMANENPGKQIQVALRESEDADKIDVKLILKEARPEVFSVSLSNAGSQSTGRDRLSLVGGHANVFDRDHQFLGAYTTSLERSKDVRQLGLNYRIPLYDLGGMMGASYTQSDVVGTFGAFSSTGAGRTFSVNYSHYLPPEGGRRSFAAVGVDSKVFNATQINGVLVPGQMDRLSRPLSIGYTARMDSDRASWGYSSELAVNLPGGTGSSLSAYKSEDSRISRTRWKAVRGSASYMSPFAKGWLVSGRAQFQYTPDALISGEQFGIGGATSVRGTGERALSADSGFFGSLEVTTPDLAPGWRALGFLDGGVLRNNNGDVNPNKPSSDHLVSAGLGLRYASGQYGVSVDWGRVIQGSVLPFREGSGIPQTGNQKIHLNLSARY